MAQQNAFEINGLIDTSKSVLTNMNDMCTAAGCWLTYDITSGLWSVVINRTGTSAKSFTNSNIIGSISVSGTGINEAYNKVSIEFPHKDLKDQTDYIDLVIPEVDRFPNELDNTLSMSVDYTNDPVQAQYIAAVELKQSRVDKVISFRTDYSCLGLRAGDLIDVTAEMYGYTNKVFRITKITEDDKEDGTIELSITALEYDANVYDSSGLVRETRSTATGIIPKSANSAITNSDNQSSLKLGLTSSAVAQGLALSYIGGTVAKWLIDYRSTPVSINADGVIITWTFPTDGEDLDIRCRMVEPDTGQYTIDDVLGWTGGSGQFPAESTRYWPTTGTPYLSWGGDNTGDGTESVLFNVAVFKAAYPNATRAILECRANWYNIPSANPVKLVAKLYQGGTFALSGFGFTNTGYTKTRTLAGIETYVDSNYGGDDDGEGDYGGNVPGDLMGYFVYDIVNQTGFFTNSTDSLG